jgi:glucosamine kinase
MRYVVGIDGGGSKTTAAVVGEDLGAVGEYTTGPANHRSVGTQVAVSNIAEAVAGALRTADAHLSDVSAVCMCLAGFDTDLDLPVPQQAMTQLGFTGPVIVENDVVGAWAGATEAQPGLVVIAGTGATALGMNARGELWRTDGWDYILGDAGSGFAIGSVGIRTAMKALDGRAAPTLLVRELADAYHVRNAEEMRRMVDSTPFGKFEIAAFGARVSHAADEGDAAAQAIMAEAGRQLAESAIAIIHQLRMTEDTFTISTVGGVFKSFRWVVTSFRQMITPVAPHATFTAPRYPPQIGAAILAVRRAEEDDAGSWTLGTGRRRIRRSFTVDEVGHL